MAASSSRTVEYHLRKVLSRTLGMTSRTQLAPVFARFDRPDRPFPAPLTDTPGVVT
jgi:hypothetical protein